MQFQTFQIVFLALVLETRDIFAQDPGSNQTFGPNLSSDQTFQKLTTKIVGRVLLNRDILIHVSLSDASGSITSCLWTSPNGVEYYVDQDSSINLDGNC
jgi:hypothetical protein